MNPEQQAHADTPAPTVSELFADADRALNVLSARLDVMKDDRRYAINKALRLLWVAAHASKGNAVSDHPTRNPPFGNDHPEASKHRCGMCQRKATKWKWINKRADIWEWVCQRHFRERVKG